jgi:hypothetical protein
VGGGGGAAGAVAVVGDAVRRDEAVVGEKVMLCETVGVGVGWRDVTAMAMMPPRHNAKTPPDKVNTFRLVLQGCFCGASCSIRPSLRTAGRCSPRSVNQQARIATRQLLRRERPSGFPGGCGQHSRQRRELHLVHQRRRAQAVRPPADETWFYPGHGKDSTLGTERPAIPEWRARGW